MTPFVRLIGPKNSGKTCLVVALVSELTSRGWRVGTIKHDAHQFEVDYPGKDTWRHRQAGSVATLICSDSKLALMRDLPAPPSVADLVEKYLSDCDLVLVEGYKAESGPAITLGGLQAEQTIAAFANGHRLTEQQVRELADRLQALLVK
jgi:molybdopterin-guanine dinucleotide biosynthesis adapter protein